MAHTPLISVLMPARNNERYVQQAIASILGQTFGDFELIVVHDASTDRTLERIQAFDDPRIRVIDQQRASGVAGALNAAFAAARGEFLARMDADDVAHPDRFRQQVQYLRAHPEIEILGTNCTLIDEQGNHRGVTNVPLSAPEVGWGMLFGCVLAHPSIMMRANVLAEAGGYPMDVAQAEDYTLWLRLVERVRMANMREALLAYRLHQSQGSVQYNAIMIACSDDARIAAVRSLAGMHLDDHSVLNMWNESAMGRTLPTDIALRTTVSMLLRTYNGFVARWELRPEERHGIMAWLHRRLCWLAQTHAAAFPLAAQFAENSARALLQPAADDPFRPGRPELPLDGRRRVAFLHDICWDNETWKRTVVSYAQAFEPEADVTLVLRVDPRQGADAPEAGVRIGAALEEAGLSADGVADMLLVTDALDSDAIARLYTSVDWLVTDNPVDGLRGSFTGRRVLPDLELPTWRAAA